MAENLALPVADLQKDPVAQIKTLHTQGKLLYGAQQYDQAQQHFSQAIAIAETSGNQQSGAWSYYDRAMTRQKLGHPEEAISDLTTASNFLSSCKPDVRLGRIYMSFKKLALAEGSFQKAMLKDDAADNKELKVKAQQELENIRILRQNANNLRTDAGRLLGGKKAQEALSLLKKAIELVGEEELPWGVYDLGLAFNNLNQFEDAKQAFESAARLLPRSAKPSWRLGNLYLRENKLQEAELSYRNALGKKDDIRNHDTLLKAQHGIEQIRVRERIKKEEEYEEKIMQDIKREPGGDILSAQELKSQAKLRIGLNRGLEGLSEEYKRTIFRLVAPDIESRIVKEGVSTNHIQDALVSIRNTHVSSDKELILNLANAIDHLLSQPQTRNDALIRTGIGPGSPAEKILLEVLSPMFGKIIKRDDLLLELSKNKRVSPEDLLKTLRSTLVSTKTEQIPDDYQLAFERAIAIESVVFRNQSKLRQALLGTTVENIIPQLQHMFGIKIVVPKGGDSIKAINKAIPVKARGQLPQYLLELGMRGFPPRNSAGAAEIIGRLIIRQEISELPSSIRISDPELNHLVAKLNLPKQEIVNLKKFEIMAGALTPREAMLAAAKAIPKESDVKDVLVRAYSAVGRIPLEQLWGIVDQADIDEHLGQGITKRVEFSPTTDFLDVGKNIREYVALIQGKEKRRREFDRIENILLSNELPEFIKNFTRFGLVYNNTKLAALVINPVYLQTSPMLENIVEREIGINLRGLDQIARAKLIENIPIETQEKISVNIQKLMLNDMFRIGISSNNKEIDEFIQRMLEGGALLDQYSKDQQSLSREQQAKLNSFVEVFETLDDLYTNGIAISIKQQLSQIRSSQLSMDERINQLCLTHNVKDASELMYVLEKKMLHPINYINFKQLQEGIVQDSKSTDIRNREYARRHSGSLTISPGDLIKRSSDDILPLILRSGAYAISLSGRNAIKKIILKQLGRTDNTPLDADFTLITNRKPFRVALNRQTDLGNLIMVIEQPSEAFKRKYEVYNARGWGAGASEHYGIRSGVPSSEISALVFLQSGVPFLDNKRLDRIKFSLSQNSFYIPLYDAQGRLIFTPEDYDTSQNYQTRTTLRKRALSNSTPSNGFIEIFKKVHPYIRREFESDAGVRQHFRIDQHTEMVLNQFENNFAASYPVNAPLSIGLLRTALTLHDIGKHEAIVLGGNKSRQHEYTELSMRQVLTATGLQSSDVEKMILLINQDYIGEYIKNPNGVTLQNATRGLTYLAKVFECSQRQMFDLLKIIYISDASSYISSITRLPSNLDPYFTYDHRLKTTTPTILLENRFNDVERVLSTV